MKKVFISGGCGFVGSHLIPELLASGNSVTVYDNLTTGRFRNIERYMGEHNFAFMPGDVTNPGYLRDCMEGHDVVWHLGANTLIPPGGENRRLDFHNNTLGTLVLLETMKDLGIKELLFASTAAVYGDEPGISLHEGFGPLRPISLYGASKLACEAFISAYSHLFGIYASIFRFSNVVGGDMGHGVIFDLIQKLKADPTQLEIWGDGFGCKPYFLVDDCIRGMLHAHQLAPKVRKQCDIFNLGCDTSTQVDRVAGIVIEEMGLKDVELVHLGGRHGFPGDVPFVSYDPSRMEAHGWRVSCDSDEAVRQAARRILDGKL
jgi:UDP-glucose 4-epimerase